MINYLLHLFKQRAFVTEHSIEEAGFFVKDTIEAAIRQGTPQPALNKNSYGEIREAEMDLYICVSFVHCNNEPRSHIATFYCGKNGMKLNSIIDPTGDLFAREVEQCVMVCGLPL